MLNEYPKKILSSRVYDVAEETPVHTATFLSERLENQIWIKREDKQPVYSFKIRGAYNKVVQLTDEEKHVVLSLLQRGIMLRVWLWRQKNSV